MSKLNKLVTNYPVSLSTEEVENLSATLAPVVAACGGGGGGGTPIYYYGDDVNINISPSRVIRLTDAATAKLNRDIPTKVSDLTDSANYQTTAGMDEYLTTANAQTTYLTKSSAVENLAPISVTGEVNTLKTVSANWNEVSAKLDTAQYQSDSATFLTSHQPLTDYYKKTETSSKGEIDDIVNALTDTINGVAAIKQDTLNFGYDENNAISSINNSALAGQGGTTYTNGDGIAITNNTINISSNYIDAITSVSGKQDELAFTYNTSDAITHINGSAIAGEGGGGTTVYEGTDGVYVDGNYIGLSAGYKTQIEAVSGKITKTDADGYYAPKTYTATVNALTGASGKWQESYEVLTAYSAAGTWLTAHQPLTNYYTKSDTSSKTELSTEFAKYQLTGDYATTSQLNTASSTLTGVDNELSGHIDYVSGHAITAHQSLDNYYTKTQIDSTFASATQLNNYLTTAKYQTDSATFALKSDLNGLVNSASVTTNDNYVMTNSGWKVLTLPGGGMTQVYHDTTLTGDGNTNDNQLGVKWETLSSNTIAYSNSAFNLTNGTSVSSFDQISAAIDSRYSKTASDGRYLQKSLDDTLTGDGTNNKKLGVAWSALSSNTIYSATKANSASAAKRLQDSTEGPSIQVGDVTTLQNWASSNSSTWDNVSAKLGTAQYANDSATFVTSSNASISAAGEQYALTTTGWAKVQAGGGSTVTIDTTNNEIKDGTSAVSAMSYVVNPNNAYWKPQRSCVCTEAEISTMAGYANGQGMLFFVVSGHNQ